ncbi:hypothetical protein [Rhizobium leguminosarum]|uniref:hypothetical protein n=1 Tax=Rhizobium leguminosarum TaxID=384 RepID=UPI0003767DB5|nr:hypothetical protein [Rhizobium leguminosarum]
MQLDIGYQTAEATIFLIAVCAGFSFAISLLLSRLRYYLPLLDLISYGLAGASILLFVYTTITEYADSVRLKQPALLERQIDWRLYWDNLRTLEAKYCEDKVSINCREIERLRPAYGFGTKVAGIRRHFDYDPAISADLKSVYDSLNQTHTDLGAMESVVSFEVATSWRTIALVALVGAYVMGFYRRSVLLRQAMVGLRMAATKHPPTVSL